MTYCLDDVDQVFKLTARKASELARELVDQTRAKKTLTRSILSALAKQFGIKADYKGFAQELAQHGWIDQQDDNLKGTKRLLENAKAHPFSRTTFDIACQKITTLIERVNTAPEKMGEFGIARIYLFGSTLQDNAANPKIGDIDLAVEYCNNDKCISDPHLWSFVSLGWDQILTNGDERFSIHPVSTIADAAKTVLNGTWPFKDKPLNILKIWESPNAPASTLDTQAAISLRLIERNTLKTQKRAQAIRAKLVETAEPLTPKPKTLSATGSAPKGP